MAKTSVFLREITADEAGLRFKCLGAIVIEDDESAKILFQLHKDEDSNLKFELQLGLSKLGGSEFDFINVIATAGYTYCIAKKLWPYLVDQFEDCLKKVSAHSPDATWDDWLRLMTACLQTNGNATMADVRKALLKCTVFQ